MNEPIPPVGKARRTLLVKSAASLKYKNRTGYLKSIACHRVVMLSLEESGLLGKVQRQTFYEDGSVFFAVPTDPNFTQKPARLLNQARTPNQSQLAPSCRL